MSIQDTNIRADSRACGTVIQAGRAASETTQIYRSVFKRLLDLTIVLLALPIVAPIVLVLALLVARDGSNPFYAQSRVGRDGRIFKMWKLRSMVPNAQSMLDDYLSANPEARSEWDETQKLQNDPRITQFGLALRKTSLDELPQLWNVLMGEMSLVGPRPMLPEQRKLYPGEAYFSLRPGMTGSWQVSERNATSFASRAEFDTSYARNLNLKTDLGILYSTVGVVVRATGI
ncbi:sugar transferase [Ruegeria conchae]|uniref:Lipopolysaccharide/colanic/teichoic acid biosynthesis glycosyltransferase n=1 Tax=Ruegeria conchae TaxID=981384 RepID=A0A497ZF63_9RHOB|nr:sugar transferase [Ruegeria conchae]RLK07359.1 lipopolysaccharide/colanic/teichoic acid biosynthesis glycosyltransferase [Ruegeria conchae]UWR05136.1 sugar transferase [Ruegeria conchae]